MSCPDISRYIDVLIEGDPHPEVEEHLRSCPSCREEYQFLTELRGALKPEVDVPEYLIQAVLADLGSQESETDVATAPSRRQVLGSSILGAFSVLGALVVTGSVSVANPLVTLAFTIALGVLSGSVAARLAPRFLQEESARPVPTL